MGACEGTIIEVVADPPQIQCSGTKGVDRFKNDKLQVLEPYKTSEMRQLKGFKLVPGKVNVLSDAQELAQCLQTDNEKFKRDNPFFASILT